MKIILFSDGTGNSSAKLFRTNVWRLYDALNLAPGSDQVAFYDNGVGTASFKPFAILGGAFGFGLKRNALDIYKFLCRNHATGGPHEIYAFGFSRGAFTIRVVLGLIRRQGLVPYHGDDGELARLATWAYRGYRAEGNPTGGLVKPLRMLRDTVLRAFDRLRKLPAYDPTKNDKNLNVAFVGLWDTVAAYGLPILELTRGWDRWVWPWSLPTRLLSAQVKKACHALSLDDERQTFHPLLWDERPEKSVHRISKGPDGKPMVEGATTTSGERVSQVWFSGMHSNVGGGYPDDGMSYDSLVWIAGESGLALKPGTMAEWQRRSTPASPMADSRHGVAAYYRYQPRNVHVLSNDRIANVVVPLPKIHHSVFLRLGSGISGYAPIVLPPRYAVVGSAGTIADLPAAAPPAGASTPETIDGAAVRETRQQVVWDLVFWRRVQYFLTVIVTAGLALLPFAPDRIQARLVPWPLSTVSVILGLLRDFLPEFASRYIEYYQRYPVQLVVGGTVIALLMSVSASLQQGIGNRMRAIWHGSAGPQPSSALRIARAIRTSPSYIRVADALRYVVVPNVFGIAMLLTIVGTVVVAALRLSFDVSQLAGFVCHGTPDATTVDTATYVNARQTFETNQVCTATGLRLERNVTYDIRVRIGTPWADKGRPVPTLSGFAGDRWPFYAAWPIRRRLKLNWFAAVARVGTGYYALASEETRITPQVKGELFLFVNDAILPFVPDTFYRNNTGDATVSVKRATSLPGS